MRRPLALAGLALVAATAAPATAQPAPPVCDVAQNCLCLLVVGTVYRVTGENLLHCV
jgi:hypothetical protein